MTTLNSYSHLLLQARIYAASRGWLGLGPKATLKYVTARIEGHITDGEFKTLLKATRKMERSPVLAYKLPHMAGALMGVLLQISEPVDRARSGKTRRSDKAKVTDVFADLVLMIAGWCHRHGLDLEGAIRTKLNNNWNKLVPDTKSEVENNG